MKKSRLLLAASTSILVMFMAPAQAVTIDYSNTPTSSIDFDPTDGCGGGGTVGCFSFTAGNSIEITSGTAAGFAGGISGNFGVGTISPSGAGETASVSNTGVLSIFDGVNTLTADLSWVDITSVGAIGGLNVAGSANLSNFSYGGSNADLVALASAPAGTQTASFQFSSATSLTDLFTNSSTVTSTSFSGSIAPVPVPAAVWLFGSGFLGLIGIARRKNT